ncbi:hypothetical protein BDW74DRAFT_187705 [Aspergillus multicolor]|uniref:FAD-dependent oxidoreductase n=1 Tax=Aspergillus multicolor TaxID=41759 RepID=UPI003CCDD050
MEKPSFRVIIVGSSIGGLTLGHCLSRAKIDFVILEKASEVAPQVGASVGILPNGGRILDQLGLYGEVEKHIEPMVNAICTYPNGFSFNSSFARIVHERFGLPFAFLERQKLLEILYTRFPDRSKIHLQARVSSVAASDDNGSITVTTEDGRTYKGDLVVGADGVHSKVRSELWTAAQRHGNRIPTKEQQGMAYCCIFGISSPVKGLNAGEQVNGLFDGVTFITIHGKNGRIYWFLIKKLERRYTYPDTPRLGPDDAASIAERFRSIPLCNGVTFGQVWDSREISRITPLEEGLFETWHYGRMVLIGDSAHKMTPNLGQGANMAMEDAASLASHLHTLINDTKDVGTGQHLTPASIESMLRAYRKMRFPRARSIYNMAWFLVRLHTRDGLFNILFGRYYAPYAGDVPADMASRSVADGDVCAFLPLRLKGGAWERYRSRSWGETVGGRAVLGVAVVMALVVQYSWPSALYFFWVWYRGIIRSA